MNFDANFFYSGLKIKSVGLNSICNSRIKVNAMHFAMKRLMSVQCCGLFYFYTVNLWGQINGRLGKNKGEGGGGCGSVGVRIHLVDLPGLTQPAASVKRPLQEVDYKLRYPASTIHAPLPPPHVP